MTWTTRGTAHDQEHAGQNEDDHRHGQECRQPAGARLESGQRLLPHLRRQGSQRLTERGAVLQRLHQRDTEPLQRRKPGALAHVHQRGAPVGVDAHLPRHVEQLFGHGLMRMADLPADPFDGRLETKPGLTAYHEHVERIRQAALDGLQVALVQRPHHVVGQQQADDTRTGDRREADRRRPRGS